MTRSTTRINNLEGMINDLPSKEQCETLIWTFMKGYHTISPLFHGPTFLLQARKYIERYLRKFILETKVDIVISNILIYF